MQRALVVDDRDAELGLRRVCERLGLDAQAVRGRRELGARHR